MNTRKNTHESTRKLAMYALLTALVIVLQIIPSVMFRITGSFPITLALTPIIIGAAIFGWKCGALLGFVFSAMVFILGLTVDGTLIPMIQYNFIATFFLCFLKGTAAGAVAGLVYKPIAKKKPLIAAFAASALTPITNTAIFALGMMSIFYGYLSAGATAAGSDSPMGFLYLTVIGVNFILEFIINIALATVITRIVDYYNTKIK